METSDRVILPVGLEIEGHRYREVVIDEMCGLDDENVTAPKIKNNGARAVSIVLRRCIQEIPGLMQRKKDTFALAKTQYVEDMYVVDRDFLFLSIRLLGMKPDFQQETPCPACGVTSEHLVVISELEVYEWEDSMEPELTFDLPVGIRDGDGILHKTLTWRFPTGKDQERIASVPQNQMLTTLIAMQTINLGETGSIDSEIARRMKTRDRSFIMTMVRHQMPGVDLRLDMFCDNCKHEWDGDVDLTRFFRSESAAVKETTSAGKKKRKRDKKV